MINVYVYVNLWDLKFPKPITYFRWKKWLCSSNVRLWSDENGLGKQSTACRSYWTEYRYNNELIASIYHIAIPSKPNSSWKGKLKWAKKGWIRHLQPPYTLSLEFQRFICINVIIRIVQELLKHKQFRGQLNVTIRFAHPYGWDAKDPIVKEEIHTG